MLCLPLADWLRPCPWTHGRERSLDRNLGQPARPCGGAVGSGVCSRKWWIKVRLWHCLQQRREMKWTLGRSKGPKTVQVPWLTKQEQIYGYREQISGYQRGTRQGGITQKFGINTHTAVCKRQPEDLLCSTANYIQCSGIVYMRKEPEKEWVHADV